MKSFAIVLGAALTFETIAGDRVEAREPVRVAVVVGANDAPSGRTRLRFAHADARSVADVLAHTGGYAVGDINLLLDPSADELLRTLDRALARTAGPDGILLFYYSGHADPQNLYPRGEALPLSALRTRLADAHTKIRIGVVDACRGGGWTGSKGLVPAAPFEVDLPTALTSQGSVLISSSSGLENAHESEVLGGSFFTHHWTAALRGAADSDGDGRITITEAFEYAKAFTVRDTAKMTDVPQHPSFHTDLSGRDDLVLASLERVRAALTLEQTLGPLQVVHLGSGMVVLETQAGKQLLRVALPTGRYLVRRRLQGNIVAHEIDVTAARAIEVHESELVPVARESLATKAGGEGPFDRVTLEDGHWEAQLGLGVRHAPVIDPGLRLTDPSGGPAALLRLARGAGRFQFAFPFALAYAARAHGADLVPWAGVPTLGVSSNEPDGILVQGILGAGLDMRWSWLSAHAALNASVAFLDAFQWTRLASLRNPNTWTAQATFGGTYNIGDRVTFNFGLGVGTQFLFNGQPVDGGWSSRDRALVFALGSVQRRGLRGLPLVRIRLSDNFSLDGHVALAYVFAAAGIQETYLAGGTWAW